MEGSPWICPRCGTATNVDNCPNCLHERPVRTGATNAPGSYFGIMQGPQGYSALPRLMGVALLVLILAPIVAALLRAAGLIR